jgi:hypothetical protein
MVQLAVLSHYERQARQLFSAAADRFDEYRINPVTGWGWCTTNRSMEQHAHSWHEISSPRWHRQIRRRCRSRTDFGPSAHCDKNAR